MINKVILIGNLGKDPEIRKLEGGSSVGKFSVATNESYQDKAGNWQTLTEWHNVVVWRSLAERAEKQLKKGSTVYIEGKLTHRSYKDKDNIDRYVTEVVASLFRSLDKRDSSGQYDSGFPTSEPETGYSNNSSKSSTGASNQTNSTDSRNEPEVPKPDDDLPF